ncbi:MAG TPA: hypothetical protein VH592_17805 [Gemmataceae bacterium]
MLSGHRFGHSFTPAPVSLERLLSACKMVWVVMTIPLGQHLHGHTEVAGGLP